MTAFFKLSQKRDPTQYLDSFFLHPWGIIGEVQDDSKLGGPESNGKNIRISRPSSSNQNNYAYSSAASKSIQHHNINKKNILSSTTLHNLQISPPITTKKNIYCFFSKIQPTNFECNPVTSRNGLHSTTLTNWMNRPTCNCHGSSNSLTKAMNLPS